MAEKLGVTVNVDDSRSFLREAAFVLFYHKRLIRTITLVTFAGFLAVAFLSPSLYLCQTKFSVSMPQQIDPLQKDTSYDSKNQYLRLMLDQKEVIMSNRVLMKVAQRMYPGKSEADYGKIVEKLYKDIEMIPPKGENFEATNVFYLNYEDKDPANAFKLSQVLAEVYLDAYSDIAGTRSESSHAFYKKQVDSLYETVKQKSQALSQYESANALALTDIQNLDPNKPSAELGVKAQLAEANRKRDTMIEEYTTVNQNIADLETDLAANRLPTILADMEGSGKAMTAYKTKIAQLQMQINELKAQFTGSYEPLKRLNGELDATIALLREELALALRGKKIQAEGAKATIAETDKLIAKLEDQVRNNSHQRAAYENLKIDYNLSKDAYNDARNKLELARQASSLSQQKQVVSMVDPPVMPLTPYKPKRILIAVLGLIGGLVLGLAAAFTMDYFDHTLKNPEDITYYLRRPCFGSLPHIED